jgi:hypothetical protein
MSATATKSTAGGSSKSKTGGSTRKGSKSAKTKRTSAKTKKTAAKTKRTSAGSKVSNKDGGSRLSPGALDGLVIGYMKRNRITNCLAAAGIAPRIDGDLAMVPVRLLCKETKGGGPNPNVDLPRGRETLRFVYEALAGVLDRILDLVD